MPCTHTQYGTATLLLEAGAGYVMTGKANQPTLPARVLNQINRVHRYRVMPHPTFRRPAPLDQSPEGFRRARLSCTRRGRLRQRPSASSGASHPSPTGLVITGE